MNLLVKFRDHLYEDCGLDPHFIPGLSIYSRNPLIGIRYFNKQLKLTLATYVFIFTFCALTVFLEGPWLYRKSLVALVCLLLTLCYSGLMVCVKLLIFLQFSYLDTSQPRPELKRRFMRDMRTRLYQYNVKVSLVNHTFFVITALYSFIVIFKNLFTGLEIHSWQTALCSALALIRHQILLKKFDETFQNLNNFELNPYNMPVVIFSEENRETLPEECSICMNEYQIGDRLLNFGCPVEHMFHEECLSKWLVAGHSCPICRQDFKLHDN